MQRLIVLMGVLLAVTDASAADNWPRFRGPASDGHSDATGLPLEWNESTHIRWKTPIHDKGWSSPVVWGDQIWMTTALENGTQMFGICVDRNSGKILFDIKVLDVEKPAFCHPMNSYATPTPVIEEGRVYLHFGTYGTLCLDTQTGKTLWERRDFPCDHWRGPASSPMLYQNNLILTFDGYDVQYVVALDKLTGKTVWKNDRNIDFPSKDGDLRKAYSTPVVIETNGQAELISPAAEATIAYDPLSGKELWRLKHGGMNTAAPPLHGHGFVFINTGYGGDRMLAMRPGGSGDVTKSHVEWKFGGQAVPTRPAPLLVGELIFMINDSGIVSCLNAITGKMIWQQRLDGNYSASPIFADGRIYLFSQEGVTSVIEPAREFHLLATNKLDGEFMASPAVAGKALYLRTKTNLYRVEN